MSFFSDEKSVLLSKSLDTMIMERKNTESAVGRSQKIPKFDNKKKRKETEEKRVIHPPPKKMCKVY